MDVTYKSRFNSRLVTNLIHTSNRLYDMAPLGSISAFLLFIVTTVEVEVSLGFILKFLISCIEMSVSYGQACVGSISAPFSFLILPAGAFHRTLPLHLAFACWEVSMLLWEIF